LWFDLYDAFADALGHVTREQFFETYWQRAVELWFMMLDGVLSADQARRYMFVNTLRALSVDVGLAPEMSRFADEQLVAHSFLLDDTAPVLERLRRAGLRVGIVTNGFPEVQRGKIARHGLDALVDFAVVSGEAGVHKPNPAIFELALANAGVPAQRAVFVGDQPDSDIKGAQGAGIQAILIRCPNPVGDLPSAGRPDPSTLCIARLSDLLPLLGLDTAQAL
jgi:putative hydrolase of the HAD superfamily